LIFGVASFVAAWTFAASTMTAAERSFPLTATYL